MKIVLILISCLLMFANRLHQFCSEAQAFTLEYPYPFMTFDAEKAAARTYDYIVVGGGAAGCPLAATLSQHYPVLVLERGDTPYGNPDVETFKGSSKIFGDPKNYPYVMEGFVSEDGVQLVRGRVLGGGTSINAGFYSRASSDYVRKMKWDEKLVNESYEWVEKLNAFKPDKLFPWNAAVKDSLLQAGVVPYNGYTLEHLEGTKIGASIFDNNGKRHTAADLLQYANPNNIVVLLNATASRVLFKQTSGKLKACGIEFMSSSDNMHYQASLDKLSNKSEVILSAGPIGSPQLLLLSGIGPMQELRKLNITVLLDSPLVGKYIQDNPMVKFIVESSKPLEFAQVQVVGILDNSKLYIESGSFIQNSNETKVKYLGLVASKLAFPSSRGEFWLRSKDPKDSPHVRYNYYSKPSDLKECMLCVNVMINMSLSSFIQEFAFTNNGHKELKFFGPKLPQNKSKNNKLKKFCQDSLVTYYHYHGGCQVGLVIDKMHQVKGVHNLRIVDNSIFKYSPGTNPQATTMMLGRYMGVRILQERVNL